MNKLTKLTGWTVVAVVISFIYNINSIGVDSVINEQTGCQPTCQTQHIESNHKTSPLQAANPLENSGPLEISSPLQSTGPLQNPGPIAASPFENGPLFNSDLNISSVQPDMNIPYIPVQEGNPATLEIGFISGNKISMQQLQVILDSSQVSDPVVLSAIVNDITFTTDIPVISSLPPVFYNPSASSYASPN